MSLNHLDHCVRCDALFVVVGSRICSSCLKQIEEEFQVCAAFLRKKENRMSTLQEMSEQTGVSVYQITEFIRQQRLIVDSYTNIEYPCEGCGKLVQKSRFCSDCKRDWQEEVDALANKRSETEEKERRSTYHIKDYRWDRHS
ncbi:hypothetical protein BEP19_07490 [Ammoniphilus oxalaticus]|uniref:Flagellar protein n=1 Tax=Ammoniphilus oxalaticus TaxID=66863 RepID=A0A419SJY2_9BACL|nr:TIGR03826 family flagellar region protein [Ammoniphilus oxalaticus]RKD24239.1 hypothetical protein BEP19_07490 [Ammoniphilus oxalaticus]